MREAPPSNRLLQLLRQKSEPHDKSDTQYATKSDTQRDKSDTQYVTPGDTQYATKSDTQRDKSDTQYVTESNTPNTPESDTPGEWVGLSKGQNRVLRYLSKNRDPEHPGQTVIIGYDTISTFCFLSRSGSRKVIGELQKKGLITRLDIRRGKEQGSVYILQSDTPIESESDTQYATKSDTRSSIDLKKDLKKLLRQDLEKLILENAFANLNPNSLSPYLDQFEALADLQNFLDMANACIETSKANGNKPIQNPHGFLFAQLRAGYVNPPPGFKSRRVLAQEAMNAQLQTELAALRQLQEQEAELRFELFKAGLSDEQKAVLEQEAAKRVKPGSAISRERQFDVYREEILREWFTQ
jgi:hypothetical protein